jgi:enamine deaminase RidA (YjgF/YER057c/UK114 family)
MIGSRKISFLGMGAALALLAFAAPAGAQPVTRIASDNPASVISAAVVVPPGYTTYYISGMHTGPLNPSAPEGSPGRWGDTVQQTDASLDRIQATLAKLGLTFGDVVKVTAFMDPKIDFPAMNREFGKRFGSAAQPNRPARSAIKVNSLATAGALVEIEMIAVKKVQ